MEVPLLSSSGGTGNLLIELFQHRGNIRLEILLGTDSPPLPFEGNRDKVARRGGTEVRRGRGVRRTVVARRSARLEDTERSALKWSSAPQRLDEETAAQRNGAYILRVNDLVHLCEGDHMGCDKTCWIHDSHRSQRRIG